MLCVCFVLGSMHLDLLQKCIGRSSKYATLHVPRSPSRPNLETSGEPSLRIRCPGSFAGVVGDCDGRIPLLSLRLC